MLEANDSKSIWKSIDWRGEMSKLPMGCPSEDSFKIHFENLLNQDIPMNDVTDCPYIPILDDPISVAETKESVVQLNPHKAAGLNGVPPGLCNLLPPTWITFRSTLLCIIFTKSLLPVEWTLSKLIILFKKGCPSMFGNYRGICITDFQGV